MDPELLALLARLNGEEGAEPLSDDELGDLRTRVATILGEIDRTNPSDEDLIVASEGAAAIRAIDGEISTRETAAAGRAEQLAAELADLNLPVAEDGAEPADGEPGDEPTADAPEGEPGDPAPEGETEIEPAPEAPEAAIVEPVAAGGIPAVPTRAPSVLPPMSRLASRAPRRVRPVPTATDGASARALTAAGSVGGLRSGQVINPGEWFDATVRHWSATRNMSPGDGAEMIYTGHGEHHYDDQRFLNDSESANEQKLVAAASSDEALIASGGICGPVAADYALTTIASADRPVRDALTQFGASRGGVRFVLPHTLSQVHADAPASIWTQATDAAPGNSTKGLATYVCQTPVEKYVDAVVAQVKLGNFQARYFPEQVDQYMATVDAEHARLADGTLLGQMLTGSTLVTGALNQIGAAADYLAHIDLAVAGYRFRHRMSADSPLQLLYPEWLEDELRADLARELPGNSGGQSERLAVADAQIDNFFTTRNIVPTGYLDNPTGANPAQSWVVQGAGPLLPWPTKVLSFLFHPGAWVFLDGGELNLGMIRDATLARTNDLVMFKETFEQAVFRGHESIALMLDLCPSGARQGTVDVSAAICASGS